MVLVSVKFHFLACCLFIPSQSESISSVENKPQFPPLDSSAYGEGVLHIKGNISSGLWEVLQRVSFT